MFITENTLRRSLSTLGLLSCFIYPITSLAFPNSEGDCTSCHEPAAEQPVNAEQTPDAEQHALFQVCQEDPSAEGCEALPFPNNKPPHDAPLSEACQAEPNSEECLATRPVRDESLCGGGNEPRALPEECVSEPESCGMTDEQIAGIQACQADRDSEACQLFHETYGKPKPRQGRPPHDLSEECISDPASCDMTVAEVEGIQACQEDPISEACQAFREGQCDEQPEYCQYPGHAVFNVDSNTLSLPSIRLRMGGADEEAYYAADLEMGEDGSFMLKGLRGLNREARGQDQE